MSESFAIGIALAIGSAVLCAYLAPQLGRPSGEWFVLGLILGVVGVAILALSEPLEVTPDPEPACVHCRQRVAPSKTLLCPTCGLPSVA